MKATPHKNAHYSIPSDEGLCQILDLIEEFKDNPKKLAQLEEEIPPHIMEALQDYAERELQEARRLRREAKQRAYEAEELKTSIMQWLNSQSKYALNYQYRLKPYFIR